MLHVSIALIYTPPSMCGATTNIITALDTMTSLLHLLCTTVVNPCSITPVLSVLVVGIDKKWCSLKAWLWAASTVCSRTMHVPFCSAGALTPFGDLHNYHPPPPPHYPDIGRSSHLHLLRVFLLSTAFPLLTWVHPRVYNTLCILCLYGLRPFVCTVPKEKLHCSGHVCHL